MEDATTTTEIYQRKRSHNSEGQESIENERRPKRQNNNTEALPLLKILIPNYAAGAIIGKGGTNIGDLQTKYGAKIRLSPSREFYPGTEERIVVLTGEVNQIIDLNNYIIDKVHIDATEGPGAKLRDEERGQKVLIIVPNATAGLVIGRGGATIKALQEETGAKIMISGRDEARVPGERIITISGNTDQRIEATGKVISKVASDAENMANKNLTYSTSAVRKSGIGHLTTNSMDIHSNLANNISSLHSVIGNIQNQQQSTKGSQNLLASLTQNPLRNLQQSGLVNQLGLAGAMGGLGGINAQQLASLTGLGGGSGGTLVNSIKTQVTIQMEIPDILVGAILGKQGKTIHEFIQFSGAKIQFSGKNDFAPGTTDRILTIHGDVNQSQIAYFLINQKIVQAENELASGLQRH